MQGRSFSKRLRFSLAALLLMFVPVCGFLAYHGNWVRQRRAFLVEERVRAEAAKTWFAAPTMVEPPGVLWLFGEHGYEVVNVRTEPRDSGAPQRGEDAARIQLAESLFPEASVSAWQADASFTPASGIKQRVPVPWK